MSTPDKLEELMENVRRVAPKPGMWLCIQHGNISYLVDRIRDAELEAASAKRDLADALRRVAKLEATVGLSATQRTPPEPERR